MTRARSSPDAYGVDVDVAASAAVDDVAATAADEDVVGGSPVEAFGVD